MLIFCLIFSILISLINGYCETEGTLSVKHYYELGCIPVKDLNGEVERFKCPDFLSFDKSKCHYHGKVYDEGTELEKQFVDFCEGGCSCGGYDKSSNSAAQFFCQRNYCEEYDKSYIDRHCINQHSSADDCCAYNIICDHDKLKDLHKCILNNVTYYQDQFIFPSNQCDTYRCICDKNFDESMDPAKNPHCVVREKCDLELTELYRFQMGCAPVYFGVEPTCPGGQYRCPQENDKVISGPQHDDESGENVCKFGQLTFRKGDKLNDSCYNCTCLVPPMLYCRQSTKQFCE